MYWNCRKVIGKNTFALQSVHEEIGRAFQLEVRYTYMNHLPPIGDAYLEKCSSLRTTTIEGF